MPPSSLSPFLSFSLLFFFPLTLLFTPAAAWLPADKIRGVNLGSLFISEPWMMSSSWTSMGCGAAPSEFDCVMNLGQSQANTVFQNHWNSWITQDDIKQIKSLGLNTIRLPLGYWVKEDIVYADSEHFPQGALGYVERMLGWAADEGLYVILDLHGAPGAQVAQNAFTGQYAPTPGFYVSWQYARAYSFLTWMTTLIHTNNAFRTVGAIELVNEPVRVSEFPSYAASLTSEYYPNAWSQIRATEDSLGISQDNRIHIVMMNQKWGSGDPNAHLTDLWYAAYDDHRYIKWDSSVGTTRADYLYASCHDDRSGNWPVFTGEWSLSVADAVEWNSEFTLSASDAIAWYKRWWAAQFLAYEKNQGWIFWNWKVELIGGRNDWRWGYQQAVAAGAIPTNPLDGYNMGACDGI